MDSIMIIFGQLRLRDLLDIAIVSVMIAVVLIWFRQRASRFVLAGLGLIATIYALALFLQLYLTTAVLQGFFAIFLFLLVVIFQEDIRRLFERLALWGMFRKSLRTDDLSNRKATDVLVQTVENLARKRVGALIVLTGDDVLERHLSGGVVLNGQLSQALLESIFDPSSPGHDGAVVLQGNMVTRFGCRLPLSTQTGEYDQLGLRHTAALGLSERTDAMCIVVSEERGTITLAMGEKLQKIASASILGSVLDSFYAARLPHEKKRSLFRWLRENQREKIIAFSLACLLWVFFGYQRESIRRDFTVPIDYKNVSAEWLIEEPRATAVKVTLLGPPQAFRLFNPQQLKLSLDLSRLRRGTNEFPFTADMLNTPSGLTVVGIKPEKIRLNASQLVLKKARVELVTEGKPAARYMIERVQIDPPFVRVLVSPSLRDDQLRIPTEPVDLQSLAASSKMTRKLLSPAGMIFPEGKAPNVTVTIKIRRIKPP